jgi:glycosyltransferase involved in cell wall biosynthesis
LAILGVSRKDVYRWSLALSALTSGIFNSSRADLWYFVDDDFLSLSIPGCRPTGIARPELYVRPFRVQSYKNLRRAAVNMVPPIARLFTIKKISVAISFFANVNVRVFSLFGVSFLHVQGIRSPVFDERAYVAKYPVALECEQGPISHYFTQGFFELFDPSDGIKNQSPDQDWRQRDVEDYAKREYLFDQSSQRTLWRKEGSVTSRAMANLGVVSLPEAQPTAAKNPKLSTSPDLLTAQNVMVSFVIPCFGQSEYLQECLLSVASSTERVHECIVIDDGNEDPAQMALLAGVIAVAPHQQVRVISQTNSGLAAARNVGIAESRSPLIKFLDADDLLVPGSVDDQIANMRINSSQASVTGFATFRLGQGGGLHDHGSNGSQLPLLEPGSGLSPAAVFAQWEQGLSIPIHTLLLETSACPLFEPRLRAKEDFRFWLQLSVQGIRFSTVLGIGALYRLHSKQMTSGDLSPQGAYMIEAIFDAAMTFPERFSRDAIRSKITYVTDFYGKSAMTLWQESNPARDAWYHEVTAGSAERP